MNQKSESLLNLAGHRAIAWWFSLGSSGRLIFFYVYFIEFITRHYITCLLSMFIHYYVFLFEKGIGGAYGQTLC